MVMLPQIRHWGMAVATDTTALDVGADPSANAGVASLSAWNRAILISTILLFLSLSVLSGRVLWRHYAARRGLLRPRTGSASAGATTLANNALSKNPYATPRNGSGHSSFNGMSSQSLSAGGPNGNGAAPVAVTSSSGLLDDESSASASTGAEMRQRFFLLLFVASTVRVLSLVTEVATLSATQTTMRPESFLARLLTLFLWLPSLLFVTMYGLVLLFWAQLCYACWGKAYPWPRRIFFGFNVLLYATLVLLFALSSTAGAFWKACNLMLGSVYIAGLFGILYYSICLIYFFRTQGPDEDFFFDLPSTTNQSFSPRQAVLRRITAVCILLCVLFAVKAVYLLGMGSGYLESEESKYRSPVGVHHIAFEFAIHFSTEFVPAALLIFFTRQSHKPELAQTTASTTASTVSQPANNNSSSKPMTPSYAFRVRNNSQNNSSQNVSTHQQYPDDSAPMLSGYQYQATQRAYGTATTTSSGSNLRGSNNTGAYLLEPLAGGGFPTSTGLNNVNSASNNTSHN